MASHIPPPPPPQGRLAPAMTLARDAFGREISTPAAPPGQDDSAFPGYGAQQPGAAPKEKATDALGRRAGALSDEIDFPAFVASLVHGTFDAIVDSSIKQMEASPISSPRSPSRSTSSRKRTSRSARPAPGWSSNIRATSP